MSNNKEFESGAQRSKDVEQYGCYMQHPIMMLLKAKVWREAMIKYEPYNFELGLPAEDTWNHLMVHMWNYCMNGDIEDLVHMSCNLDMMIESLINHPELNKYFPPRKDGKLRPEVIQHIKDTIAAKRAKASNRCDRMVTFRDRNDQCILEQGHEGDHKFNE